MGFFLSLLFCFSKKLQQKRERKRKRSSLVAIHSLSIITMGTYLEDFIESTQMIPGEVRRNFELMRNFRYCIHENLQGIRRTSKGVFGLVRQFSLSLARARVVVRRTPCVYVFSSFCSRQKCNLFTYISHLYRLREQKSSKASQGGKQEKQEARWKSFWR